jgi:hypothetical protein
MDQLDLAVHGTAHDFGLPELARKLAIREQVFRNKVNPTDETHKLTLREAVAMMDVAGDTRILEAVCSLFGGEFVRHAERAMPRDLLRALLAVDAENGDVNRSIKAALRDGRISPRELREIRQEITEARLALDDLDAFLLNDAGEVHA